MVASELTNLAEVRELTVSKTVHPLLSLLYVCWQMQADRGD